MNTLVEQILRDGASLAEELERGQADHPLLAWFDDTRRALHSQPLIVSLACASEGGRQSVLGSLAEEAFRQFTIRPTNYSGLLEISLSDSGYALESPAGQRVEFTQLPELLTALQSNDSSVVVNDGLDVPVWRVSLPTSAERRGLRLLVPESIDAIAKNTAIEGALVSQSHLLLLAVSDGVSFANNELALLQRLSAGIGYVLTVTTGDVLSPAQTLSRELTLGRAPVAVSAQHLAKLPALFVNKTNSGSFRSLLQQMAIAKRLGLAHEAVQLRFDADIRQLQSRRQRDDALARAETSNDLRSRRSYDVLRQRSAEEFSTLNRIPDETGRRALLPDSVIGKRLRELTTSTAADDLRQEQDHQSINLTLDERFQHRFQQGLRKAFKEHFVQDMAAIREGLTALKQRTEQDLEQAGQPAVIAWLDINDDDMWHRISELINFEVRYRGQLPKRSFWQRLGEGKRIVFAVLMIGSLLGTFIGVNFRQFALIGVLLLFIFIGSVWYSYRKWEVEDAQRLKDELLKVHDQLMQEAKRLVSELLQEKRIRLNDFIEQQKRHYLQQIDELVRVRVEVDAAQIAEQKDKARARLRQIDLQLKELQAISSRVAKLKQDIHKLHTDTERTLTDLMAKGGTLG